MKLIVTILFAIVIVGCDLTEKSSEEVSLSIRKEVQDTGARVIDLKLLVPFKWEELYMYSPYTSISQICRDLDILKEDCSSVIVQESVDDSEMYMVFKSKGKIVHQEMYIRSNGDFTPLNYPMPIKVNKSRFNVVEKGERLANGKPWLHLVPST